MKKVLLTSVYALCGLALVGVGFLVVLPLLTYAYFAYDLGSKERLMRRNETGIVLTDRHNTPFFTFYKSAPAKRVTLAEVPKHAKDAIIAIEDQQFYTHNGISFKGIARSLLVNFREKSTISGGSTITQQLAKNVLLSPEKSVIRKIQDITLAQEIEKRFTKDEILEMYLNTAYFGEGAYGIEAAAQKYFSKPSNELTLAESAVLAGLLVAPSSLSPLSNDDTRVRQRQALVLAEMVETGMISGKEKEDALRTDLIYATADSELNTFAPHFAIMVRDQLAQKYGAERLEKMGLTVKTTLDLTWQKQAEEIVSDNVTRLARSGVTNGASVILKPDTGEIVALVGSKDWGDKSFGKINMATAPRQPGSAFKPFIYAAAFEKGILTPSTVLMDKPITLAKKYKPQNYDKRFHGPVLPRRALANSFNVPAVITMDKLGVPEALSFAKRMGITTLKQPVDYGPSLVLGTGEVPLVELTSAYAVFANGGIKHKPTSILEIKDKFGKTVFTHIPKPEQVLKKEIAFLITSFLTDERARAEMFGSALNTKLDAAVKTGTTENYRDSLTVGYTKDVVVGVWVGNSDNTAMDRVAGSLGAAPAWRLLIERFGKDAQFEKPPGLAEKTICPHNGLVANMATSSAVKEYFLSGTEPTKPCFIATAPQATPDGTTVSEPIGIGGGPVEVITPSPLPEPSPEVIVIVNPDQPEPSNIKDKPRDDESDEDDSNADEG